MTALLYVTHITVRSTGAQVEQLAEDVLGITSQLATLTTAVTALAATTAAAHKAANSARAAAGHEAQAEAEPQPVAWVPSILVGLAAPVLGANHHR